MTTSINVELLSPAGTMKAMRYAFAYGADAVYIDTNATITLLAKNVDGVIIIDDISKDLKLIDDSDASAIIGEFKLKVAVADGQYVANYKTTKPGTHNFKIAYSHAYAGAKLPTLDVTVINPKAVDVGKSSFKVEGVNNISEASTTGISRTLTLKNASAGRANSADG